MLVKVWFYMVGAVTNQVGVKVVQVAEKKEQLVKDKLQEVLGCDDPIGIIHMVNYPNKVVV